MNKRGETWFCPGGKLEAIRNVILPQLIVGSNDAHFPLAKECAHGYRDPKAVFDRPDRRTMGHPRTADSACQTRGPSPRGRYARGAQHVVLSQPDGLPMGPAAPRSAAEEHRLPVFQAMAGGRHVATDDGCAAGAGARGGPAGTPP